MIRLSANFILAICLALFFSCAKQSDEEFYAAVTEGKYETVTQYFEKGYKPNDKLENPLLIAAGNNDTVMITLLLENGVNPNILYENQSLLQWAIKLKDIKLIELLINTGADVNFVNPGGYSVFAYAISSLSDEDLNIFLENGLNPMGRSKLNNKEVSFLEDLMHEKKSKTVKLLLQNKDVMDEAVNDPRILFALIQRWDSGCQDIADMLVEHGLKLDYELPLLQSAVGSYHATLWLLDHGVSPVKEYNAPEAADFMKTPLDAAYFGLYMSISSDKEDGAYVENNEDELERKKVIQLLEERIEDMKVNTDTRP
jgi:ankyrin repeat protein